MTMIVPVNCACCENPPPVCPRAGFLPPMCCLPPCYACDGLFPDAYTYQGSAIAEALTGCGFAYLNNPWGDILGSDVDLAWDPIILSEEESLPRYTATSTTVIDGNTETITFTYKCAPKTMGGPIRCEPTSADGSIWELTITTTAGGGSSTWWPQDAICGSFSTTFELVAADVPPECLCGTTVQLVSVFTGFNYLPDPWPDTLYLHWSSVSLGDGVRAIPPDVVVQNCPGDLLPNPIVLTQVIPHEPTWVSDCIEMCDARDDFNNPPEEEDVDFPRVPGTCYTHIYFSCVQSYGGVWTLSIGPLVATNSIGTVCVSCDPLEFTLDTWPVVGGIGVGTVYSDCHLDDPMITYSGACGDNHAGGANPPPQDPTLFYLNGITVTEV